MAMPIIAVTMGDPAGVGPEIVLKALRSPDQRARGRFVLIGDPHVFERAAHLIENAPRLRTVATLDEAEYGDTLEVLQAPTAAPPNYAWGGIDVHTAQAMLAPLDMACDLALTGRIQAFCSAPLNKEAFPLLGYEHNDELQYMAERTGCPDAFILGIMRGVWVTTVAEHVPFRAIADLITKENVLRYIRGLHAVMERAGHTNPHVAVAALNVHGGEGGALGQEEITEIGPAIEAAREQGIDAVGPIPADTVFARALSGEFPGVVGMYHDQANIARKLQPMAERVTVYEGLPVPCTTTAHGVAYDIAGKGTADAGGLEAALEQAVRLVGKP
jgi:4-hydroxy-L-threonine phosphate dehydrogenase PdxA